MADERDDEVLLTVKVDEEAVENKIIAIRKQVIGLKADKEELRKAYKAGTISAEQYATALTKANLAINAGNKEIRENERILERSNLQKKEAVGSINQMRAQLSLLTSGYNELSKSERQNIEIGGLQKQQIKELSDAIKEAEEELGDHRRSVGDYLKAFRVGGVSVSEFQDKLKEGGQVLTVFRAGLGTTRLAMIALAAVPILALLTGLVLLLTKSQAGMDKLAQYAKAGELAFNAFTDGVMNATRIVIDAFTSWDKFKSLFTELGRNSAETTKRMGEAARAGLEIAEAYQKLEAAETKLSVANAKNRAEIEKQKKLSEDTTKSNEVRSQAAQRAYDLESQGLKEATRLQQQRISNMERELKLSKTSAENRENDKKLAEERIKLYELEEESEGRQTELQNQLNQIRQEGAQQALEARKKASEELVAQSQRELIVAQQQGKDTLLIQEDIIRRQLAADLVGVGRRTQQRKLLEAKAEADIADARSKAALEIAGRSSNINQSQLNSRLALIRTGGAEELALQKKLLEDQLLLDKTQVVETIKNKKQQQAQLRLLDARFNSTTEQLDEAYARSQLERQADLNQQRLQTELDLSNQSLAVQMSSQRKQIDLEERNALALIDLEEQTARERMQLDERLQNELLVRRNAVQAKAIAARRDLDRQQIERARENELAMIDARLIIIKQGTKKELDEQKRKLAIQRKQAIDAAKGDQAAIDAINKEFDNRQKKLNDDYEKQLADRIVDTVSKVNAAVSTVYEAQAARLMAVLDRQQSDALKSAGANASLRERIENQFQEKRLALEKQFAEKRRKIAIVENIISIARGIVEAQKQPPPLNFIQAALVAVTGAAQQSVINAQRFNKGGVKYLSDGRGAYISGPGTGTSDSINARISNGESILTAKATSMFYNTLSAMNVAGGGRAFPGVKEAVVPRLPGFARGGISGSTDTTAIANAVVTGLRQAHIVVAVTDIRRKESDLIYAEAQGSY